MRLATICSFLLLAAFTRVEAHAFLDHAEPAVGSKVTAAPSEIKLWFSEKLEPALSKVQVFTEDGRLVEKQTQKPGDNTAIAIVSVPPLKPGKYKVVWKAVSVDTHVTKGDFSFQVAPAK